MVNNLTYEEDFLLNKAIKEIGWSGNFKRGQISYLFEEVDLTVFQ